MMRLIGLKRTHLNQKNKLCIEEDDMPRFPFPQSSLSAEEWRFKDNELELSCPRKTT